MAKKPRKNKSHNWRVIRDTYVMRGDMPSLNKVARQFGIDSGNISRMSKREGWGKKRKEYWNKVTAKLQQRTVTSLVLDRAKALKIVEATVGMTTKMLEEIREKIAEGKGPEVSFDDLIKTLDRQLRLRELLSGQPDSRPGEGITFEEFIRELRKRRTREHKNIQVIEAEATIKELGKPKDD